MPRGDIRMTYYLQYGAPILDRTFERRIDSTRLEGQGLLRGWRMDFSGPGGKPNIVADPKGEVWGLLFLVEEQKLSQLDTAEPGGTRQKLSCLFEWEPQDCYVYTYPKSGSTPSAEFVKELKEVYRQASLPQKQIDDALKVPA